MIGSDNQSRGKVSFYTLNEQVLVRAELQNLSPSGFRGFHIHENPVCEPEAEDGPFMTAGGHYTPGQKDHDHHAGDMPSVYVTENGTAYLTAILDRFTPAQLLKDGVAVIVHEDSDNFANIPNRYQSSKQDSPGPDEDTLRTGDAGDRAACGVVEAADQ
ncbi:superoxide dismutase family protein [Alteribacter natronophilus]|nr:superoxide dismutase family protein [Alteribacter natronophilus]